MLTSQPYPTAALVAVAEAPGLPRAGARVLAANRAHVVRSAVARCPDVGAELRSELAHDRSIHVRRQALRHSTDSRDLRPTADAFLDELVGVAGNPCTPREVLGALALHRSPRVVREVLANPSTPSALALETARRWSISELFARGNTYHHLAGAGQVARAHPEVLATWTHGAPSPGLQALASHPLLTAAQASALVDATRSREVRLRIAENLELSDEVAHRCAPAHVERRAQLRSRLGGRSVASLLDGSLADRLLLAQAGSHTIDEQLAAVPTLEPEVAIAVAGRQASGQDIDPHALAAFAERLGDEVHPHLTHLSGSSLLAAGMLSPVLARHTQPHHTPRSEVGQVHLVLGEERGGWETFVGLLPAWEADLVSLAETAVRI